MKKVIALLLSSALILTAAGCSKESKEEDKKVTEVAFEAPDMSESTKQAIKYLKEKSPLFAKYMEVRTNLPLTFEVEVPSADGTGLAGIYVKDKDTVAVYAKDAAGNSSTTIYDGTDLWYIDDTAKVVYGRDDFPVSASESAVKSYLLEIDAMQVTDYTYASDEKELDGVLYKYESITAPDGTVSEYFFDKKTDELKVIVSGESKTYVTTISSKVSNDYFKIPSDYEEKDLSEYLEGSQDSTTAQ